MDARRMRRQFVAGLIAGLRVVWPILSSLIVLMVVLGLVVGLREGWSIQESVYFAFVSGLTIGYGDLAPKTLLGRTLANPHRVMRRTVHRAAGRRRREGPHCG